MPRDRSTRGMTPRTNMPRDPSLAAPFRRRVLALGAALAVATLLPAGRARADTIPVRSAELRVEEGEVLLNADFDLSLNPTLEEALNRGIPLYFVLEVEIARPRWYWLDEKVLAASTTWRVSYAPIAQHYRVSTGLIAQPLATIDEVQRLIGRVTSRPIARASDLARGVRYDAAVRLRLDVAQLPKPFQVDALASRDWQLASDWRSFPFTP